MTAHRSQALQSRQMPVDDMPAGLEMHRLRRRLAQVGGLVVVVAAVVA